MQRIFSTPRRPGRLLLLGLLVCPFLLADDDAPEEPRGEGEPSGLAAVERSSSASTLASGPEARAVRRAEPPPRLQPAPYEVAGATIDVAAGEVLFEVAEEADPDALEDALRDQGARWVHRGASSPVWRVVFAPDRDVRELQQQVGEMPGVLGSRPNAIARGAAKTSEKLTEEQKMWAKAEKKNLGTPDDGCGLPWLHDLQWSRAITGAEAGCAQVSTLPPVTIAVLDSGVAYETFSDASGDYVQAPELATVPIAAPQDFINLDDHANDDHQHGTHLAGAIASQDQLRGHAPNPVLMPIKVLNDELLGSEWSLVEGLHWAVDHGAEVINLSLAFDLGFVPSGALVSAVDRAVDAGVVVLAAGGNGRAEQVAYPAAMAGVIAVGAARYEGNGKYQWVDYSNEGGAVDFLSPGGDISKDKWKQDGIPDGVVAQTIDPSDPTDLGYWAIAGTSQATAVASAQASRLLAEGVEPLDVRRVMTLGAQKVDGRSRGDRKAGAGIPHEGRMASVRAAGQEAPSLFVNSVAAILRNGETKRRFRAYVEVIDETGAPVPDVEVQAHVDGSTQLQLLGKTDSAGRAKLETGDFNIPSADHPLVFLFRVDSVLVDIQSNDPNQYDGKYPVAPGGFIRMAEGDAAMLDAAAELGEGVLLQVSAEPYSFIKDDGNLDWDDTAELCTLYDCSKVEDTYIARSFGAGFSASTFSAIFNDAFITAMSGSGFSSSTFNLGLPASYSFSWGSADSVPAEALDLDGTGFSSSTFNVLPYSFSMWGSGFSSSTLNVLSFDPRLSGSGFSSSTFQVASFGLDLWGNGFSSSTFNLLERGLNLWGHGFSSSTLGLLSRSIGSLSAASVGGVSAVIDPGLEGSAAAPDEAGEPGAIRLP